MTDSPGARHDWRRTNLTMLIDRAGVGQWEVVSSWLASRFDECVPRWKTYSVAATLGFDEAAGGTGGVAEARFAVVVESSNRVPLQLADVVVAPLGVGWSRLKVDDEATKGKIHRVDPEFGSTLTVSNRDYQSNCWVNWKIMGQPCEFQVQA
jgi:hypothetical protein